MEDEDDSYDCLLITKKGFVFKVWNYPRYKKIPFVAEMACNRWLTQGKNFKDLLSMMDDLSNMVEEDENEHKTE